MNKFFSDKAPGLSQDGIHVGKQGPAACRHMMRTETGDSRNASETGFLPADIEIQSSGKLIQYDGN